MIRGTVKSSTQPLRPILIFLEFNSDLQSKNTLMNLLPLLSLNDYKVIGLPYPCNFSEREGLEYYRNFLNLTEILKNRKDSLNEEESFALAHNPAIKKFCEILQNAVKEGFSLRGLDVPQNEINQDKNVNEKRIKTILQNLLHVDDNIIFVVSAVHFTKLATFLKEFGLLQDCIFLYPHSQKHFGISTLKIGFDSIKEANRLEATIENKHDIYDFVSKTLLKIFEYQINAAKTLLNSNGNQVGLSLNNRGPEERIIANYMTLNRDPEQKTNKPMHPTKQKINI